MADADPRILPDEGGPDNLSEPPPHQRSRLLRWVVYIGLGILAALFLAWAILYFTKGRFLKSTFERYASSASGRIVRVPGDFQLYFDPITVKFLAEGMTVSNPVWRSGQLWQSERIEARVATLPLIWGEQRVKMLDLRGARIDLAWDAARERNTFTFAGPSKFELPDIVRAQVVRTQITYTDPLLQLATRIRVETIRAADTRFAEDIRFTGDGTLRGRPFTMNGSLMSPNETAVGGRNQLRLAARSGDTALDVSGTLPGAAVIEGADLKIGVRGSNIANLFDFIGVATPDTRRYRISSNLTKDGGAWRFTRLTGRFGESDVAGTMTITYPQSRLKIDADLRTRRLDIVDAGPFIGYDAARLEKGQVATIAAGRPRLLPDAPLQIDAIKRFDADVKYRVANITGAAMPVSDIGLTLNLERSLMKLSPLTMNVAGGTLWSDISIDARRPAVFTTYDIRLSQTPLARLLGRSGVEAAGASGSIRARVAMSGTGDSVRKSLAASNGRIAIVMPAGSFWQRNVQLSELDIGTYLQKLLGNKLKEPVAVNCGLIAFTVRNGVAAADPIIIDTKQSVILGRGGFSFRNESLDLSVRADGKKFSLISAQSPIGVNGYFAKPGIDVISPELIGRGAGAVALGVVASPFAAILAFVDVGDAKSAQCGPVLAGARAVAQRDTKGRPRDDVGRGTTAKSEDGSRSKGERQEQRKKFLGIF